MDSLRLIDLLFSMVGGIIIAFGVVLYTMLKNNSADVKSAARAAELDRAAVAALVMQEKEKAAHLVKIEHDRIQAEITNFRIEVAKEYATATLVEKVLNPIITQLKDIQNLLHHKLDRREFEQHVEKNGTVK